MIEDFLKIADDLLRQEGRGRPRQAYLRRSLSTTYYALFHALAKLCADELIGITKANSEPWVRVYRALDHGFAKNALIQNIVQELDPAAKIFADTFIDLQEKRHTADYDPKRLPFRRKAVVGYVQQARKAISGLAGIKSEQRRILATAVLLKSRP